MSDKSKSIKENFYSKLSETLRMLKQKFEGSQNKNDMQLNDTSEP